jgi:hypothetical protein
MDLKKIRNGIIYISNGSVRNVMEDLCDELEKFELDCLAFENRYVLDHQGNKPKKNKPKKEIVEVKEDDAKEKGSTE